MTSRTPLPGFRRFPALAALALSLTVTGCVAPAQTATSEDVSDERIPAAVARDTTLTVGAPDLKVALEQIGRAHV